MNFFLLGMIENSQESFLSFHNDYVLLLVFYDLWYQMLFENLGKPEANFPVSRVSLIYSVILIRV